MEYINSKQVFADLMQKHDFKEDSEYAGVFLHPHARGITTWFNEGENTMAICINAEYSIFREASAERIEYLVKLFK